MSSERCKRLRWQTVADAPSWLTAGRRVSSLFYPPFISEHLQEEESHASLHGKYIERSVSVRSLNILLTELQAL